MPPKVIHSKAGAVTASKAATPASANAPATSKTITAKSPATKAAAAVGKPKSTAGTGGTKSGIGTHQKMAAGGKAEESDPMQKVLTSAVHKMCV